MHKMLLVFAHPDDESFAAGGTVAKYVKAGWQVDLVCATKGEAGSSGPYNVSGAALGDLRAGELKAASDILGISHTTFLGHSDGKLSNLTPGTLEDPLYRAMESGLPDVVITFDQTGVSNHPDHVKTSYATTYAFQKYAAVASEARELRLGAKPLPRHPRQAWKITFAQAVADTEPKLYYACLPQSLVQHLTQQKLLPWESYGKPWQGTPDKDITTVIEIGRFRGLKLKALAAHVSQRSQVERFSALPGEPFLQREYFILRLHGTAEVFMGKNDKISSRF